ncbi:MAG: hypothetical protein HEP71_10690 [Roseivirga sp.]|nr:hypothetical protein [Roseivirga sp.]
MKITFTLLALLLVSSVSLAQNQIKMFTNSQTIDSKRYDEVKGNPMYFKDWQTGIIIDNRDSVYNDIKLNYNGFEEEFEVQQNNLTFIALNSEYYKKIVIDSDKGLDGKIVFEKSPVSKLKGKFLQVLHKGEKISLYKYFEVRKGEVTVQDVGKTRTFENFQQLPAYYLLKDGKLSAVRMKKKIFLTELGEKKALEGHMKKNKLSLNKDLDLQKLMKFYEEMN